MKWSHHVLLQVFLQNVWLIYWDPCCVCYRIFSFKTPVSIKMYSPDVNHWHTCFRSHFSLKDYSEKVRERHLFGELLFPLKSYSWHLSEGNRDSILHPFNYSNCQSVKLPEEIENVHLCRPWKHTLTRSWEIIHTKFLDICLKFSWCEQNKNKNYYTFLCH